jgi:hypothetical protein
VLLAMVDGCNDKFAVECTVYIYGETKYTHVDTVSGVNVTLERHRRYTRAENSSGTRRSGDIDLLTVIRHVFH